MVLTFHPVVYMWFKVKGNPYVQTDARHLYKTAKLMKEQSIEVQEVNFHVTKRNGYFA